MDSTTEDTLQEPLLPRGKAGKKPALLPFYVSTFLRMIAYAAAMLPAFTLRVQELTLDGGQGLGAAATTIGIVTALRHVAEFIAAPVLCSLSDRTGRRPVLLANAMAFTLEMALLAITPSLVTLVIVHTLCGFLATGGAVEASCIADSTQPGSQRAVAMGRFFTLVGAGVVVGPALGGALAKHVSSTAPFIAASLLSIVALLVQIVWLPEYLPASQRKLAQQQQRRGLERIFPVCGMCELLKVSRPLVWCGAASAFNSLGLAMFSSTSSLWLQQAFGWQSQELGRFLSVLGGTVMVAQSVALPYLLSMGREAAVAKLCLCVSGAKFLAFALAPSGGWVYAFVVITMPGFCGMTLISSLCTRHVPPLKQGLWSGGMSALSTAAQATGSLIGSRALAATLPAAGDVGSRSLLGLHLVLPALAYLMSAYCVAQSTKISSNITADRKKEDIPDEESLSAEDASVGA